MRGASATTGLSPARRREARRPATLWKPWRAPLRRGQTKCHERRTFFPAFAWPRAFARTALVRPRAKEGERLFHRRTRRAALRPSGEGGAQDVDDVLLVVLREARVERQCERARGAVLADREHPLAESEALAHVRLQVDGRQVRRARDAAVAQARDDLVAVDSPWKLHDIDEPRALVVAIVGERRVDVHAVEERRVAGGDVRTAREHRVELLELADPERRREVVQPVVEAEAPVLEPRARVEAALVAQRHEHA